MFTKPAPTAKPFPHIFSPHVDSCGGLGEGERPGDVPVTFTTQLTAWLAGPTAGVAVASLADKSSRLQPGKVHRLQESGVEGEEWGEAVERIRSLAGCYVEEDY